MSHVRCPLCGCRFDSEQCETMPFCSERCRRMDLHRWLDEVYAVPCDMTDETPEMDTPQDDSSTDD